MAVQMRPLGTSGISVAPVALGGNVFGWTADEETSFKLLDAFVDAGGNMIDTADVYSAWAPGKQGGESEIIIGNWLRRDPAKRDRVVIATKVGFLGGEMVDGEYVAALDPKSIRDGCEASLRRLGVDAIDLYYHHKDNPAVPLAESLGAMDELVRTGKVRAIGLSQYSGPRIDAAMAVAKAEGLTPPCALQTWYNLVEREKLEGELRDAAVRNGLGIIPFYGLANGFLAGKYRSADDLAKSPRGERSAQYLDGRGLRVLAALDRISAETGAALATIALAWTSAQPGIATTLASATRLDQLDELVAALSFQLTAEQLALLTAASA
ncbi:aldo/keto reductase [Sphingomonas daechungensis]|uniref:aldo/keto reductase n=1 Tax=Sphingomonas daechungensis TaxID=1176646 RepID=UPI00378397C9